MVSDLQGKAFVLDNGKPIALKTVAGLTSGAQIQLPTDTTMTVLYLDKELVAQNHMQ